MGNKPRMGSDPFQKKDPLGWIGGDQAETPGKEVRTTSPPSNSGKPSKVGNSSTRSPSSKTSTPSKHELPGPLSTLGNQSAPSKQQKGVTTSKGLRPGWTRATFIVKEETVQQLKAVAYWDRKELKRVVEEAFKAYLVGKDPQPVPTGNKPGD